MRRVRSLLLATLLLPAAAFAQSGTISGTVLRSDTHAPIDGVIVRVVGTTYATLSRSNGTFVILGVPPGSYAVSARRFGFATRELTGVDVQIGRTLRLSFALRESQSDSTERTEFAGRLVEPNFAGTTISMSHDQIVSLPALGLSSGLGVSGGYAELPRSLATLSLADLRRGVENLGSVRAARPDATQYLVDGIAVNNPVFGSPPLLLDPLAVGGVVFSPAHVDAEHGGALSGLVDQSIRTGSDQIHGAFETETSAIAGSLGAAASKASGTHRLHAYLSGPVPFARNVLQFSIAGHMLADHVRATQAADGSWDGTGDSRHDQLIAKLVYALRPSVRLSLATIGQHRGATDIEPGILSGDSIAIPSVSDNTRLVVGRMEKRFERATISLSLANNRGNRETCSYWQGICVEDHLARIPRGAEIPIQMPPRTLPYVESGQYFGGETYTTNVVRLDVAALPTDHHTIRAGVYSSRHQIDYRSATSFRWYQGDVLKAYDAYRASPREFASYIEDALEYDLMTIHLGLRFDYGNTGGVAFTNPQDPTNGTTAREVCEGAAPGINGTPFRYGTFEGLAACFNSPTGASGRPVLVDSAARLSQADDFRAVRPRRAFSPRIGLAFPLTETSGIYFNIGRYNRTPVYHDAYRNTGLGSRAGLGDGTDNMCTADHVRPGTTECAPNLLLNPSLPDFVGNPDLSFETANAWEAGFSSFAGERHSIDVSLFRSAQMYLPSAYFAEMTPDIGLLYGVVSRGTQRTVLSSGWITSLGASLTIHSRLTGPMSYTANYTWQRSSERGASPDLAAEVLAAGEAFDNDLERVSARNRTHTLNGRVTWQWRLTSPVQFGAAGRVLLRNSRTDFTLLMASASQPRTLGQTNCSRAFGTPCSQLGDGTAGTGALVNMLYVRTMPTRGAQWALVLRVLNLLDADDGSVDLLSIAARRTGAATSNTRQGLRPTVSLRRILTGISLTF